MSWSFSAIGKPEKLVEALDAESGRLNGVSLEEFEAAKPSIKAIIELNFSHPPQVYGDTVLKVVAAGHASKNPDGTPCYGTCSVSIERLGARLV